MKIYLYILLAIFTVAVSTIPTSASAAVVYIESSRSTMSVGDTAIVTIKIDPEGAIINTVEGSVSFESPVKSYAIQEFSLTNSVFGLWPQKPLLSDDNKIVSFAGGVPGGFNTGDSTLFKIIIQAKKEGIFTVTPRDITAFLNDGNGTQLIARARGLTVNVKPQITNTSNKDDWRDIVSSDTTPPEDFTIVIGQDESIFEGKRFAFFNAIDNQSGISRYEVSENGSVAVQSGSPYVLQDQGRGVSIDVTAFDKAGNRKIARHNPTLNPFSDVSVLSDVSWPAVSIIILVLIFIVVIYNKLKRKKKNV